MSTYDTFIIGELLIDLMQILSQISLLVASARYHRLLVHPQAYVLKCIFCSAVDLYLTSCFDLFPFTGTE